MELLPGAEPGFVKIIHPVLNAIAEVSELGLAQWWRAGWVPLTEAEEPPPDFEPGEMPLPMSESQVAEGLATDAPPAKARKAGKTEE
jgi:hypothetical protein